MELPYGIITTLQHDGWVWDILKLKQKEILITSDGGNKSIHFWDSNTYNKLHSIKGHYFACAGSTSMIELPND